MDCYTVYGYYTEAHSGKSPIDGSCFEKIHVVALSQLQFYSIFHYFISPRAQEMLQEMLGYHLLNAIAQFFKKSILSPVGNLRADEDVGTCGMRQEESYHWIYKADSNLG